MAKTVNDGLLDDAIRHAVYLERVKTGQVNKVLAFLQKEVFPDMVAKLRARIEKIRGRGYDLGPVTTRRMQDAVKALYTQLKDGLDDAFALLKYDMKTLATAELRQLMKSFERQLGDMPGLPNLPVVLNEINLRTAQAVFSDALIEGEYVSKWFSDLALKTRNDVLRQMRIGIIEGETAADITKRVTGTRALKYRDGVLGLTRRQIQTNIRTAIGGVSNRVRQLTYQANDDLIKGWRFTATLDGRTSDICMSLDGQVFPVGEGPQPPQHFNCLPGDSFVLSRSGISMVSKRWFEGKLVVFETTSGRKLSCTPNHPILTDSGWIAANMLDIGCYAISDGGSEWKLGSVDVDHQNIPTSIEQIASTFFATVGVRAMPVPTTTEDFHGDGIDGEVAIVGAYGELLNGVEASPPKHITKFDFVRRALRPVSLSGFSRLAKFFMAFCASACSNMCSLDKLFSLCRRSARHAGSLLFMPISDFFTSIFKYAANRKWCTAEMFCAAYDANTGTIEIDNFINREANAARAGAGAQDNIARGKSPQDSVRTDAKLAADILSGATGPVFFDKIINIEVLDFCGHVYNLQSGAGFFAANGIITHNCRSTSVPVLESWKEWGKKAGINFGDVPPGTRASMNGQVPADLSYGQWLKQQPKAFQAETLGVRRAELFRAGKVDVSQFVDHTGRSLTVEELENL